MAVSSPGGAGNASDLILPPDQTPLHSAPPRSPHAFQAMSNDGSPSPSRTPTKEREYGTTPSSRRSGPASEDCSPLGVPRFYPLGHIDFELPGSEDAKLEVDAAREQQEGSSPGHKQRQEGSSPHRGQQQEGSSPHQVQQQTGQELEEQAGLWQQHLRHPQRQRVEQQPPEEASFGPAMPIDIAPHGTWASLPAPFKAAVAEN